MKQLIRILFLCLAIVFSFGFTVSTSVCQNQGNSVHSCCKKTQKETPPKKCNGDCCFQTTGISRFEEIESVNETKQIIKIVSPSQGFRGHFLKSTTSKKLISLVFYSKPYVNRPSFVLSKTQTWLI